MFVDVDKFKFILEEDPVALFGDYSVEFVTRDSFFPFIKNNRSTMFDNHDDIDFDAYMTDGQRAKRGKLYDRANDLYSINCVIKCKSDVIGWLMGVQSTPESFYIINTAILPEHRRKGIYTVLSEIVLQKIKNAGFQIAYSHHKMVDNRIIIAKLKQGYHITGFDLDARYGMKVVLSFFFNEDYLKEIHKKSGMRLL